MSALSTFTPTQRFGTQMLVLLTAALFGDLVLLPALLAGPFGRFFKPRDGSRAAGGDFEDELTIVEPDVEAEDDSVIDKEALPHLRLHAPSRRTDHPHRMKGR